MENESMFGCALQGKTRNTSIRLEHIVYNRSLNLYIMNVVDCLYAGSISRLTCLQSHFFICRLSVPELVDGAKRFCKLLRDMELKV